MRWNLAYRTLFYDRGKLTTGLIGVIFSVVLVNMQGGLFFGLIAKASTLIDRGNADIWIGYRGVHNVDFAHPLPERWKHVVAGAVEGVDEVEPLRVQFADISLPDGGYESIVLVGVSRGTELGRSFYLIEGPEDSLERNDGIVVDACDADKLQSPEVGDLREINGRRVRIAGKCYGVLSFLVTPYVFTDYDHAAELTRTNPAETSYLLASVDKNADAAAICDEIERLLPDVTAMTADEYASVSVNFWMTRTGLGISFGASTMLGLLVGLVMVGQTLYAMVLDRITEYATLRAIGMSEREILSILAFQSAVVAMIGIAIGVVLSFVLQILLSTPRATIQIPIGLYVGSSCLVFAICILAAGLPYLRIRRIDPHTVLQG